MIKALISVSVLLSVAILSPTCSETKTSNGDWKIRLETSGGFTGRGNGNVEILSGGKINYLKPGQTALCSGKVSAEDLRPLRETLKAAKPEGWTASGPGAPAPDAYSYQLTIEQEKRTSAVAWHDNTYDKLPEDLKAVYAEVNRLKEKLAKICGD